MKLFKNTLKTIALVAIVFSCSNNSESNQEEEQLELDNLKDEIEQLIIEGTCSGNAECDFIAIGSKPCGGPRGYLTYSTSINVDLLKEKVAIYTARENEFNKKWGIPSDCSVALPPSDLICLDGKCIAVY